MLADILITILLIASTFYLTIVLLRFLLPWLLRHHHL